LKKLPAILGTIKFVENLKTRFFEKKRHVEVPESKQLAPDFAIIKQVICDYYEIEENQLYYTKRAVFNEAKAMGMFLSRYLRGESLNLKFPIFDYRCPHRSTSIAIEYM
jgi:putative transposase